MLGWVQQRKELYQQLRAHVTTLLGEETSSLLSYRKQYEKEFNRKWTAAARSHLLESLHKAEIIFLADFHALQQSQKAQLRLLRSLNAKQKKILCVECVDSVHQKELDQFIEGRLTENEFLKSVKWQVKWGFPWENYRPIFVWAMKHKVRVIGLNKNTRDRSLKSLKRRDQFAGQVLAQLKKKNPDHQVIVIFGDLHLAEKHLPTSLFKAMPGLKKNKTVTILQNSEKIYFDLLHTNQELHVDIVQLKANCFCLLSVPPWVKWQSYLMFLENQFDVVLDEEVKDYADHVEKYYKILCQDFGVSFESGTFSVYSANDDLIFEKIEKLFQGQSLAWFQYLIQHSKSFYCPELSSAYIGKPSVNSAASLAMAALHAKMSGLARSLIKMPQEFESMIFLEAIQYFGSKMINPRRKTDTVSDLRALFSSREEIREGRESLGLALAQKMNEMLLMSQGRMKKVELPLVRKKTSYYEAARILGGMMGERMYAGYRGRLISKSTILKILKTPISGAQFHNFYIELLELIENLPEPFQSKKEKV